MKRPGICHIFLPILVVLPWLASSASFADVRPHGETTARAAAKPPVCPLVEDVGSGFPTANGYPVLWSQQMIGLDLSRQFTSEQAGTVEIPYSSNADSDQKLPYLPVERVNPALRSQVITNVLVLESLYHALILSPPPFGMSPTAKLEFVLSPTAFKEKRKNMPTRLHIGEMANAEYLQYLSSLGPLPIQVLSYRRSGQSAAEKGPSQDGLLFVSRLQEEGFHLDDLSNTNRQARTLFVPDLANLYWVDQGPRVIPSEYGLSSYFAAAALINPLSVFPALPNEELIQWALLTASHESMASLDSEIGMLNAYKLVRVAARLKQKCGADPDPALCSTKLRADEKQRAALLDFTDDAREKFLAGSETLRRPSDTDCHARRKAFRLLREAAFLHPEEASYREAVARVYAVENLPAAANVVRRGKSLSDYREKFESWAGLDDKAFLIVRKNLEPEREALIEPIKRASQSNNPLARQGAVLATSVLEEATAIEILKGVAERKDWRALARLRQVANKELNYHSAAKAKALHYVPLAKAAIQDLDATNDPDLMSYDFFFVLTDVAGSASLNHEQKRHLTDFVAGMARQGKSRTVSLAAVSALERLWFTSGGHDEAYVDRALLNVIRGAQDPEVIYRAASSGIRSAARRRLIMAVLRERKSKVAGLDPFFQELLNKGWAK